jgi:trehalose-6-phosphate synthase
LKESGTLQVKTGAGGLVSALSPVLSDRGGLWIGWPGTTGEVDFENLPGLESGQACYTLKPVYLAADEVKNYYSGFSNEILWPLFHDMQSRCNFNPAYWSAYQAVNHKFAQVTARNIEQDDFVWVHDYHLLTLARNSIALAFHTESLSFFIFRSLRRICLISCRGGSNS